MSRYHPLLVTLHWLLAVLIIAALFVGFFLLAKMPNADPHKIRILLMHMLILPLMVIRFIVRMLTAKDHLFRRMLFGKRVATPAAAVE